MSIFQLVFEAEQTDLSVALLETLETGFVAYHVFLVYKQFWSRENVTTCIIKLKI